MLQAIKAMAGRSAKYFVNQQKALGDVNGYIEEMINGQRVIKVFCHEEAAKRSLTRKNEQLCDHATKANGIANIMMPVMMNWATCSMCSSAIVGGCHGPLPVCPT